MTYYKIRINDKIFVVCTKKIRTAISRAIIRYIRTINNLNEFYLGKTLNIEIIKRSRKRLNR